MEKLSSKTLKGNWGTLLLPIDRNDKIDFSLLQEEIDVLIKAKVDGIYSNGTAGEFHNINDIEFNKINRLLAESCHKATVPFQIGISHMSPYISKERLINSISLQPSAFQVILPDWVVPNEDEQIIFLKKLSEIAHPVPLVLYNPPHSKLVLDPYDYHRLANAVPGLIGIKVASGDKTWFLKMKEVSSQLSVFVPGHFLASAYKAGIAKGSYSNVACLSPSGAQHWYNLMQYDMDEALDIEHSIHIFFDECIQPYIKAGYSNPALDKLLATIGGSTIGTRLRWPYQWIPESEAAILRIKAQKILPSFFFNQ
ncbi:MAG: dihydrodipicolinate synthase family protein [Anditalea sp.]